MKTLVVAIVAGSISGAIGSIVLARLRQDPELEVKPVTTGRSSPAGEARPSIVVSLSPTKADDTRTDERLERLERMASRVEPPATVPAPPPESAEEALRRHAEEHHAKWIAHERETIDNRWAGPTERKLDAQLSSMAGAGNFKVTHLDCRSRSCAAELEFGSYDDYQRQWPHLLHSAAADTRCGTEIWLAPPSDPLMAQAPTMIFECERD